MDHENNIYYIQGLEFQNSRDLHNAKKSYKKAGNHGPSLWRLGRLYEAENNIEKAKQTYEKAPNHGPCLTSLGNIYDEENNIDKAIEYYKKAINIGEIDCKHYLAELYLKNSINRDEAIKLLKECISNGSPDGIHTVMDRKIDDKFFPSLYAGHKKSIEENPEVKFVDAIDWHEDDLERIVKILDESLDSYMELEKSHHNLKNQYKALEERYNLLKAHLEYSPDGPGYLEAEKDFLKHKETI